MKRIYVVRHAKSSWEDINLADIDRPLNMRGKKDAPFMAQMCKNKGYIPEKLISSTAVRASKTAKIFIKEFGCDKGILAFDKALYHAPEDTYITICYGIDDDIDSVMLFGHNPGITYLANSVANKHIENVPTCGVLVVEAAVEHWSDLDFSKCNLIDFLYPKMY